MEPTASPRLNLNVSAKRSMNCRLCQQSNKKLIRTHVIPEGFFRQLRDEKRAPEIHTNIVGQYPKRSPIGVYDPEILCEECEAVFGDWDNYAQQIFLGEHQEPEYLRHHGQPIAIQVLSYDYSALKLFFISLLWRASVSRHSFYGRIRTGRFESMLRDLILRREPGSPDDFAVSLAKFEHPLGRTILDPHPERWSGVNYVRFYLGGHVAYIKVDKRPPPQMPGLLKLMPGAPLLIVLRDFERSRELPLMRKIMEHTEKMRER